MSMSVPSAAKKSSYTTTNRPSLNSATSGFDWLLSVVRLTWNWEPTGASLVAVAHSPHFDARQGRYTVVYPEVPDGSLNDRRASKFFQSIGMMMVDSSWFPPVSLGDDPGSTDWPMRLIDSFRRASGYASPERDARGRLAQTVGVQAMGENPAKRLPSLFPRSAARDRIGCRPRRPSQFARAHKILRRRRRSATLPIARLALRSEWWLSTSWTSLF